MKPSNQAPTILPKPLYYFFQIMNSLKLDCYILNYEILKHGIMPFISVQSIPTTSLRDLQQLYDNIVFIRILL